MIGGRVEEADMVLLSRSVQGQGCVEVCLLLRVLLLWVWVGGGWRVFPNVWTF